MQIGSAFFLATRVHSTLFSFEFIVSNSIQINSRIELGIKLRIESRIKSRIESGNSDCTEIITEAFQKLANVSKWFRILKCRRANEKGNIHFSLTFVCFIDLIEKIRERFESGSPQLIERNLRDLCGNQRAQTLIDDGTLSWRLARWETLRLNLSCYWLVTSG